MKIKVCGNTIMSQLKELDHLLIDYAGFIFYEGSPRYMGKKIKSEDLQNLPTKLQKIGVFVNESREEVLRRIDEYGLDGVQLHGDETPEFCKQISDHVTVIKAFRINTNQIDIDWMVKEFIDVCDYYLFDKESRSVYGGSGEKFDWNLLQNASIGKSFFLSGGISQNDAGMLKNFQHPFFYGIDLNSRFETSPGVKNMEMLKQFALEIKEPEFLMQNKQQEICGQ
ncbi:MAG: phosphoribosylanthranilate isomerase [Ginsengibacter sp.]